MKFIGKQKEYFEVVYVDGSNCELLRKSNEHELSLLWFDSNDNILLIDGEEHRFDKDDIVCLTEFHQVTTKKVNTVRLLRFNRSFYCVLDHDTEVSCKGILFFGSSNTPIIKPKEDDKETLNTVWKMLTIEMKTQDNLQLEMLQMMLKRILILCTRIYKAQTKYLEIDNEQVDLLRNYNFLVEKHFKEFHQVSSYAELLHKSPKTISNLFKKVSDKTPLQIIKNRIIIEARRLLNNADFSISDIAYELGYNDVQTFSRFFKGIEKISPKAYREQHVQ